jgi:superfamily II DNA or RNA helicase
MYGETSSGLFIGGMKPDEYRTNETRQIIVGTYSLAHEGLDIPALDTIILATPKSNIVQAVGRILRETTGKQHHPLVIDVVDRWGPIQYQYRKRERYYTETGFTFDSPVDVTSTNSVQFIEED